MSSSVNPISLVKYGFARHPRKAFLGAFAVFYYCVSVTGFAWEDSRKRHLANRPIESVQEEDHEDEFYRTVEGEALLAKYRDQHKLQVTRRFDQDNQQAATEEGKQLLALERQQRGLTLRYKATKLQLDILKLQKEIERGEISVRKELLENARKAALAKHINS